MSCHRSRCSLRNWNIDYAELWSYLVVWERWLRGENVPFFQSRSNGVGSSGSSSRDTYMGMKYDICSEPTKLSMDSIPLLWTTPQFSTLPLGELPTYWSQRTLPTLISMPCLFLAETKIAIYFCTVFENPRKCLVLQHCERSELRLHFEYKSNYKL